MRILHPGENKLNFNIEGFILLRELIVMFIVIICFAAAITGMAVLARNSSHLLENTKLEINRQNELVLKRIANEN